MKTLEQKFDHLTNFLTERDPKTASFCDEKLLNEGSEIARLNSPSNYYYYGDDVDSISYALRTVMFPALKLIRTLRPVPNTVLKLEKDSSYTTGKDYICVSTEMFSEPYLEKYSSELKYDIFLGLTAHEISHLLYTDFVKFVEESKKIIDELKNYVTTRIEDRGKVTDPDKIENLAIKRSSVLYQLYHSIRNLLEDERIETILCNNRPEMGVHIASAKHHYFNLIQESFSNIKTSPSKSSLLLSSLTSLVRYPSALNIKEVEPVIDELIEMRDLMTPYPTTNEELLKVSKEVFDLFLKISEEEFEDDGEEESEMEEALQELANALASAISAHAEQESEKDKDKKEGTTPYSGNSGESSENEEKAPEASSNVMHINTAYNPSKEINGSNHDAVTRIVRSGDDKFNPYHPNTIKWHDTNKRDREYKTVKKKVMRYVPLLRKKLTLESLERKICVKSTRSGHLDTDKLAEAVQGVPSVYMKQGIQRTNKMGICILIDESGSMGGSKCSQATASAILIAEAVGALKNIELFIYGHSADISYNGSTDMYIYQEPGIPFRNNTRMGSISARSMNRDGFAILAAAQRVRKFTDIPTLMFIISDGQPAASYYDTKGIVHTKQSAIDIEKKNFLPIHVAIEKGVRGEDMFKHSVVFDDLNTLPMKLGKLLNSSFVKNAQKTITQI